jgi:hypothetical protein
MRVLLSREVRRAALIVVVAGCASGPPRPTGEPGEVAPRIFGDCLKFPPKTPDAALAEGISGPVVLDVSVDERGQVSAITDPAAAHNAPALVEAGAAWARTCRYTQGRRNGAPLAMTVRQVVALHPPRNEEASSAPVPAFTRGVEAPGHQGCIPALPLAVDTVDGKVSAKYVVRTDGTAESLELNPSGSADLATYVAAWLLSCRFTPGSRAGTPVAVRVDETYWFYGGKTTVVPNEPFHALADSDEAELATGPRRSESCGTSRPVPSAQAMQMRLGGLVLVEYVVRETGVVDSVVLKNADADSELFRIVRQWLEACPGEPARKTDGTPVPVRVVQAFDFRM